MTQQGPIQQLRHAHYHQNTIPTHKWGGRKETSKTLNWFQRDKIDLQLCTSQVTDLNLKENLLKKKLTNYREGDVLKLSVPTKAFVWSIKCISVNFTLLFYFIARELFSNFMFCLSVWSSGITNIFLKDDVSNTFYYYIKWWRMATCLIHILSVIHISVAMNKWPQIIHSYDSWLIELKSVFCFTCKCAWCRTCSWISFYC